MDSKWAVTIQKTDLQSLHIILQKHKFKASSGQKTNEMLEIIRKK